MCRASPLGESLQMENSGKGQNRAQKVGRAFVDDEFREWPLKEIRMVCRFLFVEALERTMGPVFALAGPVPQGPLCALKFA